MALEREIADPCPRFVWVPVLLQMIHGTGLSGASFTMILHNLKASFTYSRVKKLHMAQSSMERNVLFGHMRHKLEVVFKNIKTICLKKAVAGTT